MNSTRSKNDDENQHQSDSSARFVKIRRAERLVPNSKIRIIALFCDSKVGYLTYDNEYSLSAFKSLVIESHRGNEGNTACQETFDELIRNSKSEIDPEGIEDSLLRFVAGLELGTEVLDFREKSLQLMLMIDSNGIEETTGIIASRRNMIKLYEEAFPYFYGTCISEDLLELVRDSKRPRNRATDSSNVKTIPSLEMYRVTVKPGNGSFGYNYEDLPFDPEVPCPLDEVRIPGIKLYSFKKDNNRSWQ